MKYPVTFITNLSLVLCSKNITRIYSRTKKAYYGFRNWLTGANGFVFTNMEEIKKKVERNTRNPDKRFSIAELKTSFKSRTGK